MLPISELPVSIVKPLRDRTALEKHRVILECTVSSTRCSATWYKDGKEVVPSGRVEILDDGCSLKLVIQEVAVEDEGTYCVEVGEHTCKAKLMVEGKPLETPFCLGLWSLVISLHHQTVLIFRLLLTLVHPLVTLVEAFRFFLLMPFLAFLQLKPWLLSNTSKIWRLWHLNQHLSSAKYPSLSTSLPFGASMGTTFSRAPRCTWKTTARPTNSS